MKILLIEDDPADAALFEKYLEPEADLSISVEVTLEDGIERCTHEVFDLVMLDLSLPDSQGLDTLTRFRAEGDSGPAVVLLTGLDDREMALQAVKAGAQDFVVKGAFSPQMLVTSIRHSLERHRMSQELMVANDRVRYLATHCSLTNLPNRYLFMDRLENAIASSARSGTGLAVLYMDLNKFKPINDTYGHESGDLVLRTVGERLQNATRSSDTVARLGGDEFVILLRGTADPATLARVAEKVSQEVSRPIDLRATEVTTFPSIGIAIYPSDGTTGESLLRNSDAAMYHAKKKAEPHRFWSESLRSGARYRINLERDLAHAIEHDELQLHVQPQFDVVTGTIEGFEALTRWHRPQFGWMSPLELFPLAEESGLIDDLGRWVIRAAAKLQSGWKQRRYQSGRLAINISTKQVRSASFVSSVREALHGFDLSGADFTLEVTESCLMDDEGAALDALAALRREGVRVSLDDFGSGRSSLGQLSELPVDELKIDPGIVQNAPHSAAQGKSLRAMIHLAREMEFGLIAEGVETPAQRDFLLANGCNRMQGYLFAKGMPPEEAVGLLGNAKHQASDRGD